MADIAVASDNQFNHFGNYSTVVWTDIVTVYVFYVDDAVGFNYVKSTDGGATWGSAVEIDSESTSIPSICVWYDAWTPGDSGTLIHIAWLANGGADGTHYRSLDTADDSFTIDLRVDTTANALGLTYAWGVAVTKARGGNLYVAWKAGEAAKFGFERSTDGGSSWTSRADVFETGLAGDDDVVVLLPTTGEDDDNDVWAIFMDEAGAASEWSLKTYDDSANMVSEASIATGFLANSFSNWDIAVRASDGHIIFAAHEHTTSAHDLRVWDIFGSGSITELTKVITATAQRLGCAVVIDPVLGDIYIAYNLPGTWANDLKTEWVKSTDGGATWGAATQYSAGATRALRNLAAPVALPGGGLWAPIMYDAEAGSPGPHVLYINTDNAVTLAIAATVASSGSAFFRIKDTGGTFRDISPYIKSVDGLPGRRGLTEITVLVDTGRKWNPGDQEATITLSMMWSKDALVGPDTVFGPLLTHTSPADFEYGPEGDGSGGIKYSGSCWVEIYTAPATVGSLVTALARLEIEGVVARGTFA